MSMAFGARRLAFGGSAFAFGAAGGTPPITVVPLRFATTQNRQNIGSESRTTTNCRVRWPIVFPHNMTTVAVALPGYTQQGSGGGEIGVGNDYTVIDMAISDGTTNYPITFSGSRSVTVPNLTAKVVSDETPVAITGGTTVWWVKAKLSVPLVGDNLPYSDRATGSVTGSSVGWYDPAATTVSSTDTPGSYTATGTAVDGRSNGFCPIILGRMDQDYPTFIGVGDSIMAITADIGTNTSIVHGVGFFQRAMHDAGTAQTNMRPSMNCARVGSFASLYLGSSVRWVEYAQYAKYGVTEHGTNDIGTSSPTLPASLQSNTQAIWDLMRSKGVTNIVACHLIPRTTSIDNWVTVVGQTPRPGFVAGGASEQWNAILTAKVADSTIQAVATMNSTRDPTVPQAWPVNGVANSQTSDGTHPQSSYMELMAVELRAAIAGWT